MASCQAEKEENETTRSTGFMHNDATDVQPLHAMTAPADGKNLVALKSYVDSGAARSVCGLTFGSQFGISDPVGARANETFKTATGKKVPTQGSREISGRTSVGQSISMMYSVANVTAALDSVSQICDTGCRVIFEKSGGRIETPTGKTIPFERDGDTYVRTVWVPVDPRAGFQRPGPQAS